MLRFILSSLLDLATAISTDFGKNMRDYLLMVEPDDELVFASTSRVIITLIQDLDTRMHRAGAKF
jgi:hypothetical protein